MWLVQQLKVLKPSGGSGDDTFDDKKSAYARKREPHQ